MVTSFFAGVLFALTPATHRVVFDVSVSGIAAYKAVLGNIENLRRAFKSERVQVEVVCRGGGINLLFGDVKATSERVKNLASKDVVFAACSNTINGLHIPKKRLLPFVVIVDAGVAEVVRKQEQGWSYIKASS